MWTYVCENNIFTHIRPHTNEVKIPTKVKGLLPIKTQKKKTANDVSRLKIMSTGC